jgi:hypothetical protein
MVISPAASPAMAIGTNPVGGTPTFRPSGSILIAPGFGHDDLVDVFGNYRVTVMN